MELDLNQWRQIIDNKLGLRSCSLEEVLGYSEMKCAAYGMDSPLSYKNRILPDRDNIPVDWKQTLIQTVHYILGFSDVNERYLCIVNGIKGLDYEYLGCFASCKSMPTSIVTSKSLFFAKENDIVEWVINNIPRY